MSLDEVHPPPDSSVDRAPVRFEITDSQIHVVGEHVGSTHVWAFYSGSKAAESGWIESLQRGQTIFWFHGRYPSGGSYKKQLRRGDTVLLLVEDEIIAGGILLADDSLKFIDDQQRIRRPVRIVEVFRDRPLSRKTIKAELGRDIIRQGAVHPIHLAALRTINRMRQETGFDVFPYASSMLDSALRDRGLEADIRAVPGLMPDRETARALNWRGRIWIHDGAASDRTGRLRPGTAERLSADEDDHDQTDITLEAATPKGPAIDFEEGSRPDDRLDIDARIPFVLDAPGDSEDELDRGPLALFLAQRLHLIWCQLNGHAPDLQGRRTSALPPDSDTFIAHVDSPWGGGKTTFANFIARVLDPRGETLGPRHFLTSSLAPTAAQKDLPGIALDQVFVPSFAKADPENWRGATRPWIVARYNAWRDQYVQPPWWQVFLTIQGEIAKEIRQDAVADLKAAWDDPRRIEPAVNGLFRWLGLGLQRIAYQVWNSKLKTQLTVWALIGFLAFASWQLHLVDGIVDLILVKGNDGTSVVDAKKAGEWIGLAVAILALGGASISALFTIISQSLAPDLDFTAEHKQIGVQNPISRFRRTFDHILKSTKRPVLLIVDDLDRCEPRTIVELLRGFQTIIRSPRLFVLLLGDRAWIENAHDVHHKDLSALREDEGGLGARFVQKVIQLSFRLPTIAPQARERLARQILEDAPVEAQARVTEALRQVEIRLAPLVDNAKSVGGLEAGAARLVEEVTRDLATSLPEEQQAEAVHLVQQLASNRIVAASGSSASQQRSVFNAVTQLVDSLPNNPRQIKRIFMAFAVYEVVGRTFFQYQLTEEGPDGQRRARRWRQLAMWVTLSIEWPETWRAIARRPALLNVAFQPERKRKTAENRLLSDIPVSDQDSVRAALHRMRSDPTIKALLSGQNTRAELTSGGFSGIAMEVDAVHEFNCIIWEPGFPTVTAS